MEFLYDGNKKNETQPVILRQYFDEYKKDLESEPNTILLSRDKGKKLKNRDRQLIDITCSYKEYQELAERCSIAKLTIPGEPEQLSEVYLNGLQCQNDSNITPADCSLQSVKYLYNRKSTGIPKYPNSIIQNVNDTESSLREYEHIVVCVRVYEPFSSKDKRYKGNCFSDIQLLGHQTLADLRDSIVCPKEIEFPGEVSENPLEALKMKAKDYFHSSFIFMEDVFYNDTRHPESQDYSAVVIKWAKSHGIESLEVRTMDSMKLEDIRLRFGRPYVFMHMGNCEHVVVFITARLLHPSDCLSAEKYPIITPFCKKQMKLCMMCKKIAAKWIVKDCDRLVCETTYLCHDCFMSYCYIDGKKIGNFKAYVYADRASILT